MTQTEPNYKKLQEDVLVELDKKQFEFKSLMQKYEIVQNQLQIKKEDLRKLQERYDKILEMCHNMTTLFKQSEKKKEQITEKHELLQQKFLEQTNELQIKKLKLKAQEQKIFNLETTLNSYQKSSSSQEMAPQLIVTSRFSQEPELQESKTRQKKLINSNEGQIQEIPKKPKIQNSTSSQNQKNTQTIHQSSFHSIYSFQPSLNSKLNGQNQIQQNLSMRGISQNLHENSDQQKKAEKSKISRSVFSVKSIFTNKIIDALGIVIWRFKNFKKLKDSSCLKNQHHFKWETGFFIKKNQIITTASFFILQGVRISPQNYQILFFPYVLSNQPQQKRYLKVKSFHIHSEFEFTRSAPIEKRYHDFATVDLEQEQDHRIKPQCYLSIDHREDTQIYKNDQIVIIGFIKNHPSSKILEQAKILSHLNYQLSFPQINHVISTSLRIIVASVLTTRDFGVQFQLIQSVTDKERTLFTEQKCDGLEGSPIFIVKKDSKGEIIVAGVYKGIHGNNKSASLLKTKSLQNFLQNRN